MAWSFLPLKKKKKKKNRNITLWFEREYAQWHERTTTTERSKREKRGFSLAEVVIKSPLCCTLAMPFHCLGDRHGQHQRVIGWHGRVDSWCRSPGPSGHKSCCVLFSPPCIQPFSFCLYWLTLTLISDFVILPCTCHILWRKTTLWEGLRAVNVWLFVNFMHYSFICMATLFLQQTSCIESVRRHQWKKKEKEISFFWET